MFFSRSCVAALSYIVEAYVSLRMQDASTTGNRRSKANADQAVMTPRQLLSILRLSQALARLRFSDVVAQEDVDEAIRLVREKQPTTGSCAWCRMFSCAAVLALAVVDGNRRTQARRRCSTMSRSRLRRTSSRASSRSFAISPLAKRCVLRGTSSAIFSRFWVVLTLFAFVRAAAVCVGLRAGGGDGASERLHLRAAEQLPRRVRAHRSADSRR